MPWILILKKFIGFQKYIPGSDCKNIDFEGIHWFSEIYTVSDCKNINFEEIHWFSEIYASFRFQKYQFWRNTLVFRNIYQFRITKISILKKYIGFQKYIPVSDYKNINFEEIHWFSISEIYTCFGFQKYQFWRNTLVFRNVYQFRITKISILKKYIGFQKYMPVSDYKNINFEEIHWFSEIYTNKNINFEEIHWFSEIYTSFGLQKLSILKKYIGFQFQKYIEEISLVFRNIYQFRITKISILKKYIGFQKYIPVSDYKNINFEEIHWFSEIYTSFGFQKYQFWRNTLVFRNIYQFRITKISILKKYIGFQKYIPVSDYKNINFEEIHWFSEIYTCFGLQKYQFWRNTLVFRNIYQFRITKISILKKYIGFQKYIPVSDYKNINFEEIHWFSEIYTSFGLQKYQFWRNILVFRNIYLFRITKISILKKYIGFQKYIPVSDYKNINFEEIHWFSEIYTVSDYKNINFEEIHWFSEIYTCFGLQKYQFWRNTLVFRNIYQFRISKISILKKYIGFQKYIPVSDYKNINFEEIHWFSEIYT